jgi:hypothetical protein
VAFDAGESDGIQGPVEEFVLRGFDARTVEDAHAIAEYLAEMFGNRHCAMRVIQIAKCLVLGCARFPEVFARQKKMILEKCRTLIAEVADTSKMEKIAAVARSFYKVATVNEEPRKRSIVDRLEDGAILECIAACVQEAPLPEGAL